MILQTSLEVRFGTLCKTLHLSTFGSSCEKLAKLHSPFQMAHQKVKTKLLPIPYYKVVEIKLALAIDYIII